MATNSFFRRTINNIYRLLCSYYVLLSIFFILLMLLIYEACNIIALPRPHHVHTFSFPVFVLNDLCLYVIPISSLWIRIYSPHSPWVRKLALFLAIVIMSVSISSFPNSIFEWNSTSINAAFLYCILIPGILGSISFLFAHGLYGLVCFIYRCIYKTLPKKCEYVYASCVSFIYLVCFLIGGNIFR